MSKVFLGMMAIFAIFAMFFLFQIDFVNFKKEDHLSPLLLALSNSIFIVAMYVFYRNAKKKENS